MFINHVETPKRGEKVGEEGGTWWEVQTVDQHHTSWPIMPNPPAVHKVKLISVLNCDKPQSQKKKKLT